MDIKYLFKKTFEDLKTKSLSNEPYDILIMSDLIFKLLFDSPSLVSLVNIHKVKITFVLCEKNPPPIPGLAFWSAENGIDPEQARINKNIILNINGLYKYRVLIANGKEFNIGEIIKFLRNKKGGVHLDNKLDEKQKILSELNSQLFIGGFETGLNLLRSISKITIKGIEPLISQMNL